MVTLPNPVVDEIYDYYTKSVLRERRTHLGGSSIGKKCTRQIWYEFRWIKQIEHPGRILRLFETGNREEDRMIANLKAIGLNVEGQQYEVSALGGHVLGHYDGAVSGLTESSKWHLLECKTSNKKSYNQIVKHGVEKAKPEHYDQMQFYMGLGVLERALYMVHCKDNDELYVERIRFDKVRFKSLMAKAKYIVFSSIPPDRIKDDPGFFVCRFCDYSDTCYERIYPEVNCRTCVHSAPKGDGSWMCDKEHSILSGKPCGEHLYIPQVIDWEKVVDAGDGWVEYETFINCSEVSFPGGDKEHFSSGELYAKSASISDAGTM